MFTNKPLISSLMVMLLPLFLSAAFFLGNVSFAVSGAPGSC